MRGPVPVLVLGVLLLSAACAQTPGQDDPVAARVFSYVCPDGATVTARYPDTETAQVTYKGQTIAMRIARSADGARYVGGGWQWWAKGMREGTLSKLQPGEEIASAAGTVCTAPG